QCKTHNIFDFYVCKNKKRMQEFWFKRLFLLLQIAVVAVFLGRAWQHLYWDAPYRVLLWDEDWMRPIVQGIFGWQWEDYVTSMPIDRGIQNFIRATGGYYIVAALAAIFINKWKKIAVIILWIGAVSLIMLALLYCKDKFYHIGQFLEYTLQWSSPLFLIWLYRRQAVGPQFLIWMKIAIALTFVCHGLYAIGYYPRPGEFLEMSMVILNINEAGALLFLQIVGILDFVGSILLFLPAKISRVALWYLAFWGLVTTFARVLAPFQLGISIDTILLQHLHESIYRMPHFLVPLALVIAAKVSTYSNRQDIGNPQQV
ncbi:MAG: hypothetical protein ACK4TA_08820, partial [Saprospiraceae bacterium]